MIDRMTLMNAVRTIGLILALGMSMSADAGLFGFGGTSWKEEVLLHDGSKLIVKRSQSRGGSHEIGQPPPIKEQSITFTLPNSNQTITWKSEYGEDVGRANFDPLAVHVLNGTPYIVATPNLCLAYNKWGRPNPPYVIFRFDGKAWSRIPLSEFPAEFKSINLVVDTLEDQDKLASLGFVSTAKISEFNSDIRQPEYRTILREALPQALINSMCEERVNYKGNWILPNDPIARKFIDQQKK